MYRILNTAVATVVIFFPLWGQSTSFEEVSAELMTPIFDARLSIGFNYDLLRPPTEVSFDYPKGYFGLNIPVQGSVNPLEVASLYSEVLDKIFRDSTLFQAGDEFKPRASARQSPNTTFRVDVPMLGGVCSFSNIQNVALSYVNVLGFPGARIGMSRHDLGVDMLMRAAFNVPLEIAASWETMSFGYAFRPMRFLTLACNLHRHLFVFDMRAKISGDVLGYVTVDNDFVSDSISFDYSTGGDAFAHYDAEVWSPTLAVKFWRLGTTARFGVNTRARGRLNASYWVPFFVNAETFKVNLKPEYLTDLGYINRMKEGDMDTVSNGTSEDMTWKLPDGITFSFDILSDRMNVSYTKTTGNVRLALDNLWRKRAKASEFSDAGYDTIDLDIEVEVDNIIMLSGVFSNVFFNVGLFTLDFHANNIRNIFSRVARKEHPTLNGAPILPVFNAGSAIGSRMQLLLELDILPLMALKTGIIYYF